MFSHDRKALFYGLNLIIQRIVPLRQITLNQLLLIEIYNITKLIVEQFDVKFIRSKWSIFWETLSSFFFLSLFINWRTMQNFFQKILIP